MIQVFLTDKGQLTQVEEVCEGAWVNIVNPTPEEKDWIIANTPIEEEYLVEAQDLDEQSRVEREDDALLIVLRVPHFQGVEDNKPFITLPLLVVISEHQIYTICSDENIVISEFEKSRVRGFSTLKKNKFLLQIMFKTASKFLVHLRNINNMVEELENELENSLRNKELIALLRYDKALVYYTTALKSNEAMMNRLKRARLFSAYDEDEELLEDVIIENSQAIEMTNITQKILSQMTSAYSSIINNNVNYVIKFLTLVTICISIPTLVASFYGMNIPLPGQKDGNVLFGVVGISVMLIILTIIFFRRKNWV